MAFDRFSEDTNVSRWIKIWLITGLLMVFLQIVIGGVTRLTGSGLSITRWEIVTGSIPPLNDAQWQAAFDLYKATPQYKQINEGMTMGAFKFIFFWEYFHRLWARLMFFVFIIPFAGFIYRGLFTRRILPRMVVVILLAGLEGFFGWIMVASGLIKRPWVNAYNLTLHLTMALVIFSYLLWTIFIAYRPRPAFLDDRTIRRAGWGLLILLFIQLSVGAMMSGAKAGLFFPSWPDMDGAFIPAVLLDGDNWLSVHFIDYDTNPFMPALLQFFHRMTAYILAVLGVWFGLRLLTRIRGNAIMQRAVWFFWAALFLQVLLGILTVINCKAAIPVYLGVAHQAGAVILLSALLYLNYLVQRPRIT